MQRTSIFTSSHKLISTEHVIGCPNCAVYEQQLEKLREGLVEKYREIEIAKPVILNMLENQDMVIYEEELYRLKRNYEELRSKIAMLGEENGVLLGENSRLKQENKGLAEQLKAYKKQYESEQQSREMKENNRRERQREQKSILSETSTNIMDKSLFGGSRGQNKDIIGYLNRREGIQQYRHAKILRMEEILAGF